MSFGNFFSVLDAVRVRFRDEKGEMQLRKEEYDHQLCDGIL